MADIAYLHMTKFQGFGVLERVRLWRRRWREREQLARLTERDLHDLGLSRTDIYAELRKPFWRA